MTREEAIDLLDNLLGMVTDNHEADYDEAIKMAIQALTQEPCDDAVSREMALEKMADYVASGYADSVEDFEEYSRIICQLPSVTQKSEKWIPVSERLPEWDIECLVVDDKGEFGVGFYRDDVGAWDSPSWGWLERKDEVDNHDAYYMPCGIGKVIAWMPLPKPYEPKESEDKE